MIHHLTAALADLVPSAEPAVVFTSLARQCVPAFSDVCTIDVSETYRGSYRIVYPRSAAIGAPSPAARVMTTTRVNRWELRTPIRDPWETVYQPFVGEVIHSWNDHEPTASDAAAARMAVDLAVSLIRLERQIRGLDGC